MRTLVAALLAVLLLLSSGAQAKQRACRNYSAAGSGYVSKIRPLCMPEYYLDCTSSCRRHLKKVNLSCFSALIKESMPQYLDGSIRFYKGCAY